jgi:anti-anti-sigma regulatory factor
MNPENVIVVSEGLCQIRKEKDAQDADLNVVLDVEKLSFAAEPACRQLRKIIEETGWDQRKLVVCGVSEELKSIFAESGLDAVSA